MTVLDIVATANIKVDLSDLEADAVLRKVLRDAAPELLAIQEWDGHDPFTDVDPATKHSGNVDRAWKGIVTNRRFARHPQGGGPVVWDSTRYGLLSLRIRRLAPRQYVGNLKGRKSILPASIATVARLTDEVTGRKVALVNFHLTAEVQLGPTYRKDAAHKARVQRHRKERRALRRLVVGLQLRGWTVYACGDTNFDSMPLRPLISCWRGRDGNTLGKRAVDLIYTDTAAKTVRTIPTRSDHDCVVATYLRKES